MNKMSDVENIVVVKKRGRKKKVVDPEVALEQVLEEQPKPRRGRKTKNVTNTYVTDQINTSLSDDENIIVKLNINATNGKLNLFEDETGQLPNAYDALNSFESTPLNFEVPMNVLNESDIPEMIKTFVSWNYLKTLK
jgi:hypothetical protein